MLKAIVVTEILFLSEDFTLQILHDGKRLKVCKALFMKAVAPVTSKRVRVLIDKIARGIPINKELRGGKSKRSFMRKKEKVRSFISRLRAKESHYGRNKSVRVYLPSELSVKRLWRIYNKGMDNGDCVSYSGFYSIFMRDFNIGFSSPRVDVCSTCELLKNKLKVARDENKISLQTRKHIHNLRAKAFYSILKDENPDCYRIAYDMQQVHSLPRLPIGDTYYSRQLSMYNFGVCDLTAPKKLCYTWLESQAERGSNEVGSAVYDFLMNEINLEKLKTVKKLRLISDGCAGQNKNRNIVGMAMFYLRSLPKDLDITVELVFPVRGHSFLPCDRMFGNIEKELKKIDTIPNPSGCHQVIHKHCDVLKVIGSDYSLLDWKEFTNRSLEKLYKIQSAKRIVLSRSSDGIYLQMEEFYKSNTCIPTKVSKGSFSEGPFCLSIGRTLSSAKLEDIRKLLVSAYGSEWQLNPMLSVYKDLQSHGDQYDDEEKPDKNCSCCVVDVGVRI